MGDVDDARGGKRDRLARFYRVLRYLREHPDGARVEDVATFVGVSRRTAYRDLNALEGELGIPVWADGGRWGVEASAFLPPLRLTREEAMAIFLAARLFAKYADAYDPDLGGAFQKLAEALPEALGRHVARTLDVMARRPPDAEGRRRLGLLTRAWAERRIVELTYDPSGNEPGRATRRARVHPYLIEPSTATRALYLIGHDESRGALRTFKLDRIRELTLTPDRFESPEDGSLERALERAWGIIADQGEVEVRLRFAPAAAFRVREAIWHPTQVIEEAPDGSLLWRARVSGTIEVRLWILQWGADVEVLAPAALRDDVASTFRRAAGIYEAAR